MKDNWIKVSKKMPDEYGAVLAFDPKADLPYRVAYPYHDGKKMIFDKAWNFTHWMPLPPNPK